MKNTGIYITCLFILVITGGSNCSKNDTKIKYETGFFPEETINMEEINSSYDDFNIALPQLTGDLPLMFSSNRNSQGSDFDIVSGVVFFVFNQVDGEFTLDGNMTDETFYATIEGIVNTERDELGPYRFFNSANGMEYFIYSEEDENGKLNLKFLEYSPVTGPASSSYDEPRPVSIINSLSNDAYLCFSQDLSAAYFCSDRNGNYDIMYLPVDDAHDFDTWLTGEQANAVAVDSINSDYDEKCPFIKQDIMVFASDRAGGLGGFDLYYSVFDGEAWSSPVNMGPDINTEYNEYRPVLGNAPDFINHYLLFSSDRPSGLGGYDLYFRGIDLQLLKE